MNKLAKVIDLNRHISENNISQAALLDEFDDMLLKILSGRVDLIFSLRFDFLLNHFEKTGDAEISELCSVYKKVIYGN